LASRLSSRMRVPFINTTVVLFSVFLTLGICLSYWVHEHIAITISAEIQLGLLFLVVVFLLFAHWQNNARLSPTSLFGVLVCVLFFGIGYSSYSLRFPKYIKQHYTHHTTSDSASFLQLKIREILKPNTYYHNVIAEVTAVDGSETKGDLLIHLAKDSLAQHLSVDEILFVQKIPEAIRQPLNPHQFNYAQYMKNNGVYTEITLKHRDILFQRKGKTTLVGFSASLRNFFISKLKESSLEKDQLSIVQALVLGQRRDISKELYNAYAAAGAIHILAVSGLHVGILYFIFMWLFRPLSYFKHGNTIRSVIIVVLLWAFAMLASLSPSVVRAVTMFSFFTLASSLNRPTNSFNTLFLSYLLLLLLVPHWLFQVGFQLSYLAVFFILWLQPKLYNLYTPKFYIDKMLWGITTVTIAAQVGIVPLSLYYFHQFPGLFFITNLVILPVLGLLLAGGLLLVIMAAFNVAPDVYVEGYNFVLKLLNEFIVWVATQDSFLFADIPFSEVKVLASYLVIVSLGLLWKNYNAKTFLFCLSTITIFCGSVLWDKKRNNYHELVVFNQNRNTLVAVKETTEITIMSPDTTIQKSHYLLKGYNTQTGIKNVHNSRLPTFFRYKNQQILVLDSLGVYNIDAKPEIVLLTSSPRVNLDRLIDSLSPRMIVADGSNYRSYVDRWRRSCSIKKLPFHHTGTKGAFTLK